MAELSDKGAKYFWFLVFPILAISSYLSQAWLAIWGFKKTKLKRAIYVMKHL
jgi:hypothetical protein